LLDQLFDDGLFQTLCLYRHHQKGKRSVRDLLLRAKIRLRFCLNYGQGLIDGNGLTPEQSF